jgi:hypothetical protein
VKPNISGLLVKKHSARLQHSDDKIRISKDLGIRLSVNKEEHLLNFRREGFSLECGDATIEVAGPSAGSASSITLQTRADVNLEAEGNINLEAPNGEIRINGRRINLNERPGA